MYPMPIESRGLAALYEAMSAPVHERALSAGVTVGRRTCGLPKSSLNRQLPLRSCLDGCMFVQNLHLCSTPGMCCEFLAEMWFRIRWRLAVRGDPRTGGG
ncbi:unnamed protein product [Symbiodinium natans]|uniref:Uncharacterized protein n=1 Tax=Symbiodinium natans TaxID=878477 RepID=A0A812PFB8_9DINO|nr:unnamed protein product [Symbiodinium natans]